VAARSDELRVGLGRDRNPVSIPALIGCGNNNTMIGGGTSTVRAGGFPIKAGV
jgi:hypothetical protein